MRYPDIIVYALKNIITGMFYFGVTENLSLRTSTHLSLLRNNKHPLKPMQQDFNKYGINSFVFGEIKRFRWYKTSSTALDYEKQMIESAPLCYNIYGNKNSLYKTAKKEKEISKQLTDILGE